MRDRDSHIRNIMYSKKELASYQSFSARKSSNSMHYNSTMHSGYLVNLLMWGLVFKDHPSPGVKIEKVDQGPKFNLDVMCCYLFWHMIPTRKSRSYIYMTLHLNLTPYTRHATERYPVPSAIIWMWWKGGGKRGGRIVAASEMLRPSVEHVQQAEVMPRGCKK